MPSIKDEHEDSDGEEMEHESGDSDKSSSCCDTSDAASDSDDSSEMDEEECERRRHDCMENLADLERQFSLLREQLYRERITQVDTKLNEVRSACAQEYLQPLEQLQENMRVHTEVAGIYRDMCLVNIHNKFECEEQASLQNLENEKKLLWHTIHDDLQEKIRRLEEDHNNLDLNTDIWHVEQTFNNNKSVRRGRAGAARSGDTLSSPRKKPVTVWGPYIVYMLRDVDILEDWTTIKKALSVSKRKSECK